MAEQVKLTLEAIGLQERKAIECFFALVRKTTPQMRAMAERYGRDVSFNFDSNGRSVWVVALFGKGAPAFTLLRRAQDRLRAGAIALRDAPMGLLSANGV